MDDWVFRDREPVSLNWERGGMIDNTASERITLRKCEVARLFEFPERVQLMVAFGGMTKWICDDIRRGHYLWSETQDGISLRRAKKRCIFHS